MNSSPLASNTTSVSPEPAAGLDLSAIKALLRAMAPVSYQRGVRFVQQASLGLLLFSAGGIAAFSASSHVPAAGLWLLAAALPYLALRWWQAGLVPRSMLVVGLAGGGGACAATALWLGLHGVLWGTLVLCSALILLALAGRNAHSAWLGLGPLRGMLNPAALGAISATAGETK